MSRVQCCKLYLSVPSPLWREALKKLVSLFRGAQSSTSAVMVILCKPPAAGERTRSPRGSLQVPSGHSWAQLTCPTDLLLLLLAHLTESAPLCIHSFHWSVSLLTEKTIWILFKNYLFQKEEDEAFWACWLKVGLGDAADDGRACSSVLINQQLCQRPVSVLSAQTYLSFKMITIRKLGPSEPYKCWHLFLCC